MKTLLSEVPNLRWAGEDVCFLPRYDKEAEAVLDSYGTRIAKLTWRLDPIEPDPPVEEEE